MQREHQMTRQIHDLVQGSEQWHQFRQEHDGASEAAAALGLSKKVKRSELIHMKATGLGKEFTAWVQENILDHGHVVEAMARPLVEKIIGDDLYPVTCSLGRLSASCDGLNMAETIAFEHKQWNAALAAAVTAGQLPDEHAPQCQQVLMVTGAEKLIFVVSDGTEDNMVHMWVYPDAAWFERINAGWEQFDLDVAAYVPEVVAAKPVGKPSIALPALVIQTRGEVTNSNLPLFQAQAEQFLASINTELESDQDFADADQAVKDCEKAEREIEAAKGAVTAQMSTVEEVLRIADHIKELIRAKRLLLTRLLTTEKARRKDEILAAVKQAFTDHVTALDAEIKPLRINAPTPDFAGAMKNKRTLASLQDAVDTMLASAKISTNATAADYRAKQAWCKENAAGHGALFMDMATIITKPMDDFQLVITTRVAAHQAAEAKKEADMRAQIAAEEKAKAEAAAKAKADAADAERIANEQAAAALAERNRQAAEAAERQRAADAAEANVLANAVSAPAAIPASAAPEIARTASFYGEGSGAPARAAELQVLADQNLGDKRAMATASRVTGVPVTTRPYSVSSAPTALLDAADAELHPTDDEILELGADFGLSPAEWIARLEVFITAVHAGQIAIAA